MCRRDKNDNGNHDNADEEKQILAPRQEESGLQEKMNRIPFCLGVAKEKDGRAVERRVDDSLMLEKICV